MVLSKKRITEVLIRLRGCAGWSAPVLFADPDRHVFLRRGPCTTNNNDYCINIVEKLNLGGKTVCSHYFSATMLKSLI